MKDEVQRISKLVAEGRLSPEDAADLIDAFYSSDRTSAEQQTAGSSGGSETDGSSQQKPPPPPHGDFKDPFKSFVESVERLTKEGMEAVNWQEVANTARQSTKKGIDALKVGIEDLSKGKVHMGWLTSQEEREISLPLALGSGKTLKIENPCGNVKVIGGFDVGTVTARARFKAGNLEEAKAKARDYVLSIEESDHGVLIRQPDISGLSVDLEVQMPGNANVELRVDSGNVEILDTKGGARVTCKSGNAHLRGLVGPIEISAESGDISIEDAVSPTVHMENKSGNFTGLRIRGNVQARVGSGNIKITDSSGKVVTLETVSGNVELAMDEPITGAVNVRTVSGNSHIAVPDQSDCRVSLSTLRGSVSSSIELADGAKTETRVTGKLGDGSGTLDVSAVTGDIGLEMRSATVTA